MTIRVGINGFGRIGRLVVRGLAHRRSLGDDLELVHVNDPHVDARTAAHLVEFDTVHGRYPGVVGVAEDAFVVDDQQVTVSQHDAPGSVPWQASGVDIVLECSGVFKTTATLEPYFDRGVRKVIVAAPVKSDGVLNIVMGCNDDLYDAATDHIVTAASCTTNCLAPVVKVLHEQVGIERGAITTIHDVTNTQVVVDAPHKDLRRARSALNSLIPTTTGSATAITMIYPELTGKLNGTAVRVPLLNASLTDAVFTMQRDVTVDEINDLLRTAAEGELAGILGLRGPPARLGRLHERHPVRDRRRALDDGDRRPDGQGADLVRQRVRLRVPHGRPRRQGRVDPVNLRNYALVTGGYWAFTLTDGALRMLVLLHFNELGYSPVAIAFLFLLYEFMGIITNLIGGWVGSRTGLNRTLMVGLALQVVALVALTFQQESWAEVGSVVFVMGAQALSGVAKDLTKMSSKSAVKFVAGDGDGCAVQDGGAAHRVEERAQGRRILPRRSAARRARIRRGAVDHGGRPDGDTGGDRHDAHAATSASRRSRHRCGRSSRNRRPSTACRRRGSSCSPRVTSGSWWPCRSTCTTCSDGRSTGSADSSLRG